MILHVCTRIHQFMYKLIRTTMLFFSVFCLMLQWNKIIHKIVYLFSCVFDVWAQFFFSQSGEVNSERKLRKKSMMTEHHLNKQALKCSHSLIYCANKPLAAVTHPNWWCICPDKEPLGRYQSSQSLLIILWLNIMNRKELEKYSGTIKMSADGLHLSFVKVLFI